MNISLYTAVDRLKEKLDEKQRFAFLSTFLCGLFVHMYMFTNKFPNHDDIICLFRNDETVTSGRWFLPVLIGLSSDFSLPWLNGLLSLLYLSLLSVLLVRFFGIRRKLTVLLCSLSLICFPSVANAFGFMFTADGYMAAFLLSAVSACLCDGKRWSSLILSVVLLTLSIASYQATLPFFVALLAVRGLLYLYDTSVDDASLFRKLIRYIGCAVVSAILYILSAKLALLITGKQMEQYAGLEHLGHISIASLPGMVIEAWWGFFRFVFITSGVQCGLWMSILHLSFGLFLLPALFARAPKFADLSSFRKILLLIVILCLPLLLNSASFLGSTHIHVIMMFGICMVFWIGMILAEDAHDLPAASSRISGLIMRSAAVILPICVLLISFGWALYANRCYLKMQLKYENAYALANRIVDRIESDPGYAPGTKVAFIGEPALGNYPQAKDGALGSLGRDEGFGGPSEFSFIYDDRHLKDFIKYYIGVRFDLLDDAETQLLSKDVRVLSMPAYPVSGSVGWVDRFMIVKLS